MPSKSLCHHLKHYAQRSSEKASGSSELTLFCVVGDSYSGSLAFPFLGLNPTLKMRSDSDGWIKMDLGWEYKPSPRCSLCQTGPSAPGSWAALGTGTSSAQKESMNFNR